MFINDIYQVVYSTVNQAWFVLEFGNVVAIKPTKEDALYWCEEHKQMGGK